MFRNTKPPVILMGGLYRFEIGCGIAAPAFIERLIECGTIDPDAALDQGTISRLVDLIAFCDGQGLSRRRAARLIQTRPAEVGFALQKFLHDPLSDISEIADGEGVSHELPSVLDMRTAWIADLGSPEVFDQLTLWEHSRIQRQLHLRHKAAIADAAVAARAAQADRNKFKRFLSEMSGVRKRGTTRDWAQHVFHATSHLPKITQEELAFMKGRA